MADSTVSRLAQGLKEIRRTGVATAAVDGQPPRNPVFGNTEKG